MINKIRSKMISIQDKSDSVIIRSWFGGKRIVSKNDISILDNKIFNNCCLKNLKFQKQNIYKYKHILSIQGFCSSGSTAAIDLLREFDNTTTVSMIELDTANKKNIKDVGIEVNFYRDLYLYKLPLLMQLNAIEIDMLIKEIVYRSNYHLAQIAQCCKCNRDLIYIKFSEMINNIVKMRFFVAKDINKLPFCSMPTYDKNINQNITPNEYLFYELRNNINEQKIISLVKEFINFILNSIESKDFLVLDQFIATRTYNNGILENNGYDLNYHKQLICNNLKQIVVYRDLRDQFMDNWKYSYFLYTPLGANFAYSPLLKPLEIKNILDSYKTTHPDRLFISFESLVNDYENSVDKICNFLGIDKSHHVNKFRHFRPEVSRKNIGIYKHFHDQSIMEEIYKNFKEYCYEN